MRESKFRGKEIRSGKWVYGYFYEECGNTYIIENTQGKHNSMLYRNIVHYVEPKTVGQYTGLKDCSGVEIYDGDILSTSYPEIHKQVYWVDDDTRYQLRNLNIGNYKDGGALEARYVKETGMVVMGNIYDNPELREEDIITN